MRDLRAIKDADDGYHCCPLAVERGKIVLAKFDYGGKLLPSFPSRVIERHQTQPSGLAAEGTDAAADLLKRHALRAGLAGQTAAHDRRITPKRQPQ